MKRMMLVTILLSLCGALEAEEPVEFGDAQLKAAVEYALWIWNPTPTDMLSLTELVCVQDLQERDKGISSLDGLEYATNLSLLNLRANQIANISPLSGLTNLRSLDLSQNEISDLSPLSSLTGLDYVNLHENRISDLSPLSTLDNVTTLICRFNEVSDLSPLSGMTGLSKVDFAGNQIADLSGLSGLANVVLLILRNNQISDISALGSLTTLTSLDLGGNQVSDVWPLLDLGDLRTLNVQNNQISDISALAGLTHLDYLDIRNNPLPQEAYDTDIPQIIANNPDLRIEHDHHVGRLLWTSSTAGGSIVAPGEGEFAFETNACVRLTAQADPGFVFAGWSGTYTSTENPMFLTMNQDYRIQAHFVSLLETLHVDGAAPEDPGPDDPDLSDPYEDGTPRHPFDCIQEAVAVAADGARIIVRAGIYHENVDFLYKDIHVIGADPNDPGRDVYPVIVGAEPGPVVQFPGGQGAEGQLTGFVITGGHGYTTGAVLCENVSPAILHCLIIGNRSLTPETAAVYCTNSEAVLLNCTIADNYADWSGAALMLVDSAVTVFNSILWNREMVNEIVAMGTSDPNVQYCSVRGWWPDWGNIHQDPLFARHGYWASALDPNVVLGHDDPQAVWISGDYHVLSRAGRWDPLGEVWVRDETSSPCIDAGDPSSALGAEPEPNGAIVNIGAYGATNQAARSTVEP